MKTEEVAFVGTYGEILTDAALSGPEEDVDAMNDWQVQ